MKAEFEERSLLVGSGRRLTRTERNWLLSPRFS
jgi:hypothetical protein